MVNRGESNCPLFHQFQRVIISAIDVVDGCAWAALDKSGALMFSVQQKARCFVSSSQDTSQPRVVTFDRIEFRFSKHVALLSVAVGRSKFFMRSAVEAVAETTEYFASGRFGGCSQITHAEIRANKCRNCSEVCGARIGEVGDIDQSDGRISPQYDYCCANLCSVGGRRSANYGMESLSSASARGEGSGHVN
jgi:hypothetical protein